MNGCQFQGNKVTILQPLGSADWNLWYLCSVPMVEAPGDAMSECSDGIQVEGPTLHHRTTKDKGL